ncbi:hypothetical protein PHYBOEH_008743 [Phytophthora boehmeriae]|uniref:Uncharacterized protein n=1 Tax=Phytophthora boehmeriae TaxID=109152 RepID=A0A8T1X552_9STRA|nr:hypothetical protein PHYBOEH_008743 [Phytophthora boehmeriae]
MEPAAPCVFDASSPPSYARVGLVSPTTGPVEAPPSCQLPAAAASCPSAPSVDLEMFSHSLVFHCLELAAELKVHVTNGFNTLVHHQMTRRDVESVVLPLTQRLTRHLRLWTRRSEADALKELLPPLPPPPPPPTGLASLQLQMERIWQTLEDLKTEMQLLHGAVDAQEEQAKNTLHRLQEQLMRRPTAATEFEPRELSLRKQLFTAAAAGKQLAEDAEGEEKMMPLLRRLEVPMCVKYQVDGGNITKTDEVMLM